MTDAIERKLARHPQRAAFEMPVLAAFGRGADAERRHQLVEEAVEMVRTEHHHEVGLELVQRGRRRFELAEELRVHVCSVSSMSVVISGLCEQQMSWTAMLSSSDARFGQRAGGEHFLDRQQAYRRPCS